MNEDMQLETVQTDKNHTAVWQPIGAGRYSVVVYSAGNDSFEHNECLLKINCTGAGTVSVSDALLVDADRQLLCFDSISTDMMTGIDVVDDGRLAEEGQMIYTIDGRRVSTVPKNKKGVYVVNNKKMVVR